MADVFISYAREDKAFVHRLYEAFTREGREAWVDWEGIPPASEFPAEIQSGIEEANAFLFIISPYSVASDWCRRELAHAVKHNKRLVPILYSEIADETTVPETIRTLHWISARADAEFETALQSSIKAIDTDLEWVRAHTRLTVRAVEWDRKERSRSYVLRGEDLQEAEQWLAQGATKDPRPTALQTQYILASRQDATRRQRTTLGVVIAFCIIVGVAAAVAFYLYRVAEGQRQIAEDRARIALSRQLAAQSTNELGKPNYELALLLAIEAGRTVDTKEAFGALRQALAHPARTVTILFGHEGVVRQADWNADGSRILTVSEDGTARVWDAETGDELLKKLSGHAGRVEQAEWNADGSRILTVSYDATARVWTVRVWDVSAALNTGAETGAELFKLSGHTRWEVNQALWNADGSRILTAGSDGTARVWDAETGAELVTLSGHTDGVKQAEWNADESRILTVSEDGTVRVWDAETEAEPRLLSGHTDSVRQAEWNADGSRILTASSDGTARVWDAETGTTLVTLSGHGSGVLQAVWNADGSRVLTASYDGTARVWDAETGEELVTLSGPMWWVNQAVWNADESRILTASQYGIVRQYYTRMEDLLEVACQRAPRNMTGMEWQRFMGGEPYRRTCPNLPAHPSFIASLIEAGSDLARAGHVESAIAKYAEAKELDPTLEIHPDDRNTLCWFGSLWGYAADVMDACEQAVELAPDDGAIRDSRGLARALTGDCAGAIEDFKSYVEWLKENDWYEPNGPIREAWIAELEAGRNPFDEATLEELRKK